MSAIEHVDQLLMLHGAEFVDAAYVSLLGREADPAGRQHYLNKLALGTGKAAVLMQLAESKECRARAVKLTGLDRLVGDQRRARHWFWGTLLRSFRIEKQAHRLDFQMGALIGSLQKLQADTELRFARWDDWMSRGGPPGAADRPSAQPVPSGDAWTPPGAGSAPLSQPARQILTRLNQARARTARESS